MSMTHYFLSQVTASAGGQIAQISEQSLDPQTQEILENYDGQVDLSFAAVMRQRPMKTFSTTAIAAALTAVPISGLPYTGTDDPVDFYYQPAAQGGTRDTTACVKVSSAQGMLVITSITADENSPAVAQMLAYAISADGIAAPMTLTNGVSLPAQGAVGTTYVVGPVKINGTAIPGVKSIGINFGLNITCDEDSGAAYPTLCYIAERRARATIRTTNVDLATTLGLFVNQDGVNKSLLYLRKVAPGGTRVPDGTAQHIKFTISSGMIFTRRVGGAGSNQPQMLEIDVPITFDGTNAVIGVSTASAIT